VQSDALPDHFWSYILVSGIVEGALQQSETAAHRLRLVEDGKIGKILDNSLEEPDTIFHYERELARVPSVYDDVYTPDAEQDRREYPENGDNC
jgi:hypothetical protein